MKFKHKGIEIRVNDDGEFAVALDGALSLHPTLAAAKSKVDAHKRASSNRKKVSAEGFIVRSGQVERVEYRGVHRGNRRHRLLRNGKSVDTYSRHVLFATLSDASTAAGLRRKLDEAREALDDYVTSVGISLDYHITTASDPVLFEDHCQAAELEVVSKLEGKR